uniref:Uncharacterized protein n=1 Tax=Anguilla anguilla TaxID=7936 RepID=A0A0E9U596_ANGAN
MAPRRSSDSLRPTLKDQSLFAYNRTKIHIKPCTYLQRKR